MGYAEAWSGEPDEIVGEAEVGVGEVAAVVGGVGENAPDAGVRAEGGAQREFGKGICRVIETEAGSGKV
jgi:hypothetical protein